MNKIVGLLAICMLLITLTAQAQQEVQVSHNMFNQLAVNPGFAGANGEICATLIGRRQWMGFPGAPETDIFSVDGYIKRFSSGLGLTIWKDKLGVEGNIEAKISYAYRLKLQNGSLGFGPSVSFINKTLNFGKLSPISAGDQLLTPGSNQKNMIIDVGFGAHYKAEKLEFGLATTQLIQSKANFETAANFNLKRHYFINAGYKYDLSGMPLRLNPSVYIKTDAASVQFDINCLAIYNQKYWGGLTYRQTDALAILLGAQPFSKKGLSPIKLGIAYDVTTSKIKKGSVEAMLGYCFKIEIEREVETYRNVRFL